MPRPKSATVDLKVRMKEPLRARIEKSAKLGGRSLNAEVVRRLESSFAREEQVSEALGGDELYALFRMLGAATNLIEERLGKSWSSDYEAFIAVRSAWDRLLKEAGPEYPADRKARIDGLTTQGLMEETKRQAGISEIQSELDALKELGAEAAGRLFPARMRG